MRHVLAASRARAAPVVARFQVGRADGCEHTLTVGGLRLVAMNTGERRFEVSVRMFPKRERRATPDAKMTGANPVEDQP